MVPSLDWRAPAGRAGRALFDLLLPRACAACERLTDASDRGVVCGRCWARVRELPRPRCDRCGHPETGHRCRWCDLLPAFVRAVRSVCWVPGATAGAIVHALKYGGWTALAEPMAARMARLAWPRDVIEERALLIAVPLAPARLRERGFNQSLLLADALARHWGIPSRPDVLTRARVTASQTRLTPEERRRNVSGAFRASPHALAALRRAHVMLVDDVVTTGATASSCAAALFHAGARVVSIVTFGRAPMAGDRT